MKKWTCVSPINDEARWQYLSQHVNQLGVANQFVPWQGSVTDVEDISTLDPFQHVRMTTSLGLKVLKRLKVQSSWATLIGVIDGMVKTEHGWWPLCAMYEGFGQILIRIGQELDMRGSVLVAGAGGMARTAVAAFFKAGFKNILLTNFNVEEADALIRELRSKMFGMNVQWVPMEKIVLLPGESSALINCTPTIEENALLIELSYLNFLKRPGFLFDTSRYATTSVLVQEALDSGVKVIDGGEIAARADVLWAKWAFDVELSLAEYRKNLPSAQPPAS